MRALSASQELLRARGNWSVVWLLEIDAAGQTIRYCNREARYYSQAVKQIGGNDYDARLESFGPGRRTVGYGIDYRSFSQEAADAQEFVIRNLPEDDDRLTDVATAGLDGCICRFGMILLGDGVDLAAADIFWIHTYIIESVQNQTDRIVLRCQDMVSALMDRTITRVIRDVDFPGAPSEVYGRVIPLIYGSVTNCPLIPVSVGASGALDGMLLAEETVIAVQSLDGFPRTPAGGGFEVQIEEERIWVPRIDEANRTLGMTGTPCIRGFGNVAAYDHPDGAEVWERLVRYDYLVADHPCYALTNLRCGGRVLPETQYDLVTQIVGDRTVQLVRFWEPPLVHTEVPGSAVLKIDGSRDEAGARVWSWVETGENTALDPQKAVEEEEIHEYATLKTGNSILALRMGSLTGDERGRLKKVRLGIEYYASQPWDAGTWPYIAVKRQGAAVRESVALKRPKDGGAIEVDPHAHTSNDDWKIGDTTGLFDVAPETDHLAFDEEKSGGSVNTPPGKYWWNGVFTDFDREDGVYRIQSFTWYLLFDGYPKTAEMKITLPNGRIIKKVINRFSVPQEFSLTVNVPADSPVTYDDIITEKVKFYVSGTLDSTKWVSLDSRLSVETKYYIAGQDTGLTQAQINALTTVAGGGGGAVATQRATQLIDLTQAARAADFWDLFDGTLDILVVGNFATADDTEIYVLSVWIECEYQPTALEYVRGDLTADVSGYMVSGNLVEHPVDILIRLLYDHGGVAAEQFDSTSFVAERDLLTGEWPAAGRWIGDRRTIRELAGSLAREMRRRLLWEGTKFYLKGQAEDPAAALDWEDIEQGRVEIDRSPSALLVNQLAIYYNYSPEGGYFRRVMQLDDLGSQATIWGVRRDSLDAWWITTDGGAAQRLGAAALSRSAGKYNLVRFTVPISYLHVERGDLLTVTHDTAGLDEEICEVVGIQYPRPDRITLSLAWSDVVTLYQTEYCRVTADRGGARLRFYADKKLVAILTRAGDFTVRGRILAQGGPGVYAEIGSQTGDFLCIEIDEVGEPGHYLVLRVQNGSWMYPLAFWGDVKGVSLPYDSYPAYGVRLHGTKVRVGADLSAYTPTGYVTRGTGYVLLSADGITPGMVFETKAWGDPDYPGIWSLAGTMKSGGMA